MKTNNILLRGLIIGVCIIIVPIMIMGTNYTTEKENIWGFHKMHQAPAINAGFLVNTGTGEIYYVANKKKFLVETKDN